MLRKSVLSMRGVRTMSTAAAPQEPALTRVRADRQPFCTLPLHRCLIGLLLVVVGVFDRCMVG